MLLDDGGNATMLVIRGAECEAAGAVPDPESANSAEARVFLSLLQRSLAADGQRWTRCAAGVQGVTEETTTGVHRLYQLQQRGALPFPAINVNDFGHQVQVRQPLRLPALLDRRHQPGHGRDAGREGRRHLRYGDVGKGCAKSLRGQGAPVVVTEIDPICALQALMEGFEVRTLDEVVTPRTSSSPPPGTGT